MNAPSASAPAADLPLSGYRIVEACSYISGPYCAMILADLGAEVIKVEPIAGDPYRSFGHHKDGLSAVWVNVNRGKRAVALDLKSDADRARLLDLLADTDLFIENWRPRVAKALGLDLETLSALNPKLIRLSITGFGEDGPLSSAPAFDALLQGRTGLVSAPNEGARNDSTPFFMIDKTSAMFAAQSALAALLHRERTGKAQHVKLNLLDTAAYFNFPDLFQHRTFLDDRSDWRAPPSPVLKTADGWIVLSPVSGKQLGRTLEVVGHPEWKDDFKKIADRVEMAHQFFRRIAPEIELRESAYWIAQFEAADVPVGPVYSADGHLNDPQVVHNALYAEASSPVGPVRSVRFPATFDGAVMRSTAPAPALGEHNDEIFAAAQSVAGE